MLRGAIDGGLEVLVDAAVVVIGAAVVVVAAVEVGAARLRLFDERGYFDV